MSMSIPAGVGVDIVEFKRVRCIPHLRRFAEYFLTPPELADFEKSIDKESFVASRFAAKEAVIKSFPGFLRPHDFAIMKSGKKPVVKFLDREKEAAYFVLVSLSHSVDYAAGYATLFLINY